MPARRPKMSPENAPVLFPRKGTPPDAHGYPHYAAIGAENALLRRDFERLLKKRRRERQAHLEAHGKGTSGSPVRWKRRVAWVRAGLAKCLGLARAKSKPAKSRARCTISYPLHAAAAVPGRLPWESELRAFSYSITGAAWDGGALEMLVLRPASEQKALPGILLIPDAGACLLGGQSPASAARAWGCALARAGFLVGIPRLPSLEEFSATRNKRKMLEGACVLGEVVGESAGALAALRAQKGVDPNQLWAGGEGVGGLAALLLGALDSRVAGVLAAAPTALGNAVDDDALLVPRLKPLTDLFEIAATLAPRPLALVEQTEDAAEYAPPSVRAQSLARAAAPAYALLGARKSVAVFAAHKREHAVAWLRQAAAQARPAPTRLGHVIRGERPQRCFAIRDVSSASSWRAAVPRLRRAYLQIAGMPLKAQALAVRSIGVQALPDGTRLEYHVRTGQHTWSNVTFLRPLGLLRRRVTILCLPGSGSDVARVEREFAHEVLANGWNACIIDARAALYPFYPGVSEGLVLINQSLHDLRCCLDWVARREDVDPRRIGTMGVSQGGTHSWMLAAMDERIAAAAPICGVCTYRSLWSGVRDAWYDGSFRSFLDSHSNYYFTPGVLRIADQQDLCGLIAPRPFALIGANHDDCFPLPGMRECARDLKRLYKLVGAGSNFRYVEFEGVHSMPEHTRRTAYAFFREHLEK